MNYRHIFGAATLALVLVAAASFSSAWAVEVAVAVPSSDSTVVIPWGAMLSEIASTVGVAILGIITFGLRKLPGNIVALLQTMRAEQLLQKAIDYGVNATASAAKDKALTVPVGNAVIAAAAQYAIENGAPAMVRWLGGPEGVVQKLIARLDLEEAAEVSGSAEPTEALVVAVQPAAPTSQL